VHRNSIRLVWPRNSSGQLKYTFCEYKQDRGSGTAFGVPASHSGTTASNLLQEIGYTALGFARYSLVALGKYTDNNPAFNLAMYTSFHIPYNSLIMY
jgi:hypothetical protein